MKEEEFRKLLEKSIDNTLTEKEEQLLEEFHEKLVVSETKPFFKYESDKSSLMDSIWFYITKKINAKRKSRAEKWKVMASTAAVFVGLLTIGHLYWEQTNKSLSTDPINMITLELEDGTIKVLEEEGMTNVTNKSGHVVGRQDKNQLIYDETKVSVNKLVYNTLTIPYGRTFELTLSDGTKAFLNAGSSLKYPIQFLEGMDRKVFVTGEVFLDVAKDKHHPFLVKAENLNVKVYGTQFNIQAYPEDDIAEVVLVEGSVGLYTNKDGSGELNKRLEPGYKASYDKKNKKITTDSVITEIYTSWMKGELVFRNMSFDNILKKMERHYDVKIINKNEELSKEMFNASFGNKPAIEEVFEELKVTYHLDFKINGNTITIE
jgi:transmembrane sensor